MSNQRTQRIPDPHGLERKLGSYVVSVETFTHSQFQRYMLYGFRVRASQKDDFSPNFSLSRGTYIHTVRACGKFPWQPAPMWLVIFRGPNFMKQAKFGFQNFRGFNFHRQ